MRGWTVRFPAPSVFVFPRNEFLGESLWSEIRYHRTIDNGRWYSPTISRWGNLGGFSRFCAPHANPTKNGPMQMMQRPVFFYKYQLVKWSRREDYSGLPALRPSGHLRYASMFKIVPDNFVEPLSVRIKNAESGYEKSHFVVALFITGRGERIRTSDPCNPIAVRYQTAPRPDIKPIPPTSRARRGILTQKSIRQ